MIAIEPNVLATGRYSVNETCTALGISRETLRKYTNSGDIRCYYRRATARKFYKGCDILSFWRAIF